MPPKPKRRDTSSLPRKLIAGLPHVHTRCVLCGELVWTQDGPGFNPAAAPDRPPAPFRFPEPETLKSALALKDGKSYPATRKPREPRETPPPAPRHPYSDFLSKWLTLLTSGKETMRIEFGGISAMLAEKDKWDRRTVREFILPMLDTLTDYFSILKREIENANHKG